MQVSSQGYPHSELDHRLAVVLGSCLQGVMLGTAMAALQKAFYLLWVLWTSSSSLGTAAHMGKSPLDAGTQTQPYLQRFSRWRREACGRANMPVVLQHQLHARRERLTYTAN